MRAGQLTLKLSRDDATGRYTYQTTADPSMLARFFISSAALERSMMEIGPDGVRPIEWQFEDGKSGTDKDGHLHSDWSAKRRHRRDPRQEDRAAAGARACRTGCPSKSMLSPRCLRGEEAGHHSA